MSRNKPTDVMLDLLRGVSERGRPSSYLVASGKLFGFSENTVRVTLSRLVNRGLLACPERGRYRLDGQTDALQAFIERWRLGEQRVKPWQTDLWLLAIVEEDSSSNKWSLESLGFREVRNKLYVRPDNLDHPVKDLLHLALEIGLDTRTLFLSAQSVNEHDWTRFWDTTALNNGYRDISERLEASSKRLLNLPIDEAQRESFSLGGEAIKMLAKDPLLPSEWVNVSARKRFWHLLLAYDLLGKDIWASAGELHNTMPVGQLMRSL